MKVNFDAGYQATLNRSSSRVIIRDSEGVVMGSFAAVHVRIPDVF